MTAEDLLGNSRPHSSRLVRRRQQPQAAFCVPVRLQAASQGGSGTRGGGHGEAPPAPTPTKSPRTGDQGVPHRPEWRRQRHPPRRTADTLRLPPPGLCLWRVTCATGRRRTTQTTSAVMNRPARGHADPLGGAPQTPSQPGAHREASLSRSKSLLWPAEGQRSLSAPPPGQGQAAAGDRG